MNPDELIGAARKAMSHAHAPYSGYKVGAALLCADGTVFTGCNVESASYGLTQCAERNALAAAVVAGARPGELHELVVYATGFEVLSPCGGCRQVMSELLTANARVHSCSGDGSSRSWRMDELFPDPFVLE